MFSRFEENEITQSISQDNFLDIFGVPCQPPKEINEDLKIKRCVHIAHLFHFYRIVQSFVFYHYISRVTTDVGLLYYLCFRNNALIDDLNENISNLIDSLIWIHPKKLASNVGGENDFKYTSLIGNKNSNALIESDHLHIGLMYLSSGTTFPQHAREAKETCLILSGTPQLGATLQHLEKFEIGSIVSYANAAPRVFMVMH